MTKRIATRSPGHRQVAVKVNALVDKNMVTLVEALSRKSALQTLNSCEGAAFVEFVLEDSLEEQARFLISLGRRLIGIATLTAEWGGGERLLYTLRCSPKAIDTVASVIEAGIDRNFK